MGTNDNPSNDPNIEGGKPVEEPNEPEEQEPEGPNKPEEQEPEEQDREEEKPEDGLPEWARESLSKANSEAAKYRVRAKELQEELDELMSKVGSFEELQQEYQGLKKAMLVRDVADEFGLPKELAEVLKGDSEEEIREHAETLAKFVPRSAGPKKDLDDLKGGLDPEEDPSPKVDPVALARTALRFR